MSDSPLQGWLAVVVQGETSHPPRHYSLSSSNIPRSFASCAATNLCPCDACVQADNLKLKFVAHIGEVATQTIRDRRKLVGIDVILVHRLLKNPVQAPEYVLFSEELYRTGGAALADPVQEVSHDLEGIGPVRTYFVDIADVAGSPPPMTDPRWLQRLGRTVDVAGRGLPYMLGLRNRRRVPSGH